MRVRRIQKSGVNHETEDTSRSRQTLQENKEWKVQSGTRLSYTHSDQEIAEAKTARTKTLCGFQVRSSQTQNDAAIRIAFIK